MAETDWIRLWRDLVERFEEDPARGEEKLLARWSTRAPSSGYTEEKRRRDRDDPLMQCFLGRLGAEDTVLDIGAGIGRWSIPTALVCRKVTALGVLPGMLEILRENAAYDAVDNIETVLGDWETVDLEPHDCVLSSHAAYISRDSVGYARKMERLARKACFMVLRVPTHVPGKLSGIRERPCSLAISKHANQLVNRVQQSGLCATASRSKTPRPSRSCQKSPPAEPCLFRRRIVSFFYLRRSRRHYNGLFRLSGLLSLGNAGQAG